MERKGFKEIGYDKKTGQVYVKVDPVYFRPTDVDELRGDAAKARRELKWKPKTSFKQLVKEMMVSDLKKFGRKSLIKNFWRYIFVIMIIKFMSYIKIIHF